MSCIIQYAMIIACIRSIMYKKMLQPAIIIAVLFLIFFLPKASYIWGSATGRALDCQCFGLTKNLTEVIINGSTQVYCYGVPYSCRYNPRYEVPFSWVVGYWILLFTVYVIAMSKKMVSRKHFLYVIFIGIACWYLFRVCLAIVFAEKSPLHPDEILYILLYILIKPLIYTFAALM